MQTRRERNVEATKERILEAGLRLFGRSPARDVTAVAIADEADVAIATFYNHHESLEQFREELRLRQHHQMVAFTERAFAEPRELPVAIACWIQDMWHATERNPVELRHAARMNEGFVGVWGELEDLIHASVIRHFPDVDPSELRVTTLMIRACTRGALRHWMDEPESTVEWKHVAYPILRVAGTDNDAATDAITAANAIRLERLHAEARGE